MLDDDAGFEVESRIESEKLVAGAGVAIGTAVFATPVGIETVGEGDVGAVVAADDRAGRVGEEFGAGTSLRDRFAGSVTGRGRGFGVGNHFEGHEAVLRPQIGAAAAGWSGGGMVHCVVSQTDELVAAEEKPGAGWVVPDVGVRSMAPGMRGVDSAGEIRVDFAAGMVRWRRTGTFCRKREKTEFPTPLLTLTTTPIDEPLWFCTAWLVGRCR